tara:strand:+ start:3796 stop:4083 length:288 start_codon:yes stop_codon:yes gene_type:complete
MTLAIELLTLFCTLTICLRLLLYRRAGARFKRHYALLAWLIIAASGGLGLSILVGAVALCNLSPWVVFAVIYLAVAVHLSRGNVAQMIHIKRWFA